jgi:outer membrane lipoprotein-sorting protein
MKKLFLGLALSIGFISLSQAQNVNEITKKILDACGKADNVTYDFFAYERFAGTKKVNSEVHIRVQETPLKIYADSKKPTVAKLVYIPSVNPKILVKKGLSLKLDLYSKLLMADQHHPLNQAGFGTFKKIIEQSIKSKGYTLSSPELGSFVKILGTVTYDEKSCWKVEINDLDYKIISHKVTADEKTVWDLGRKYSVPEYRIKEINDIGNELTEGQVIKMPSAYAKKTTVFIDKTTFLPIYQKMEDDAGIYEIYEFKNLKINVKFTDDDFKL